MDANFLKKRINQTRHDIFPLDRMLSLEAVYAIFREHYDKEPNKGVFMRDRKYQRLREGYSGLFVAISLQDTSENKQRHFMSFPEKPDNDFYIMHQMNATQMGTYEFDAKEFTNYSPSFKEFVDQKIAPRIGTYNIVITTYRKIEGMDAKYLINLLQKESAPRQIWLLGAPTKNEENSDIKVSIMGKSGVVYNEIINLNDWLDKTRPAQVYHDMLRLKYPPSST